MNNITLDNEPIHFDGPTPKDIKDLFRVLTHFLQQQDRCISSFKIDGVQFEGMGVPYPETYKTIDIHSETIQTFILRKLEIIPTFAFSFTREVQDTAFKILNDPWDSLVAKLMHIVQVSGSLINLMAHLEYHAERKKLAILEALQSIILKFKSTINLLSSACALRDPSCISDILTFEVVPILQNLIEFVEHRAIPALIESEPKNPEPQLDSTPA